MKVLFFGSDPVFPEYGVSLRDASGVESSFARDRDSLVDALEKAPPALLFLSPDESSSPLGDLLPLVKKLRPDLPVVVLSRGGNGSDPETAYRLGAHDYLALPLSIQELTWRVSGMMAKEGLAPLAGAPPARIEDAPPAADLPEEVLFEVSPRMQALRQMVDKIKDTDLPILITGESGTGKEVLARYLWRNGPRRHRPLMKVNCAAIPSELLESELFGFEKGAFTGAHRKKLGKFGVADGGTLILDEISELPYPLQSKLLHVLQDGHFTPLGSTEETGVDVRIIAATNRVLEEAVRLGTFRGDLFFRLNVLQLLVPPLRSRREDILPLAQFFLERFAQQYRKPVVALSPENREFLQGYPWPGNVRELENLMRRCTVLGGEGFAREETPRDTTVPAERSAAAAPPAPPATAPAPTLGLKEIARRAAREAERDAILQVLVDTHWNRKKAAKRLEISYKTLLTKIKETGLDDG